MEINEIKKRWEISILSDDFAALGGGIHVL